MRLAKIEKENNTLWLIQDIGGLGIYETAKSIVNFCDKETKLFEREIDRAILDIFKQNGIEIPNTDKSVLKLAFGLLNSKGKDIVIVDRLKDSENYHCTKVCETKNHFCVMLEDDRYIQCCVEVVEKDYE